MRLFKTAEQREAAKERRAQKRAAARERRAQERFERSPVGQATVANERGDALFQVAVPVDEDSSKVLSDIEAIGWKLDHVGYAFEVSGDSDDIGGELTGVYLFRPAARAGGETPHSSVPSTGLHVDVSPPQTPDARG